MRFETIVVGVDGSKESIAAATLAARLAKVFGARLRLMHAVPDLNIPFDVIAMATGGRMPAQHIRAEAKRRVRAVLRNAVPDDVLQTIQVESGAPPVVLRDAARRYEADLVVLGAKQRSAVTRALAGSVVPYLLRTLDVPILLAADDDLPTRILAAVDLSQASNTVLETAVDLADVLDAQLEALHVAEPVTVPVGLPIQISVETLYERAEHRFSELLGGVGKSRTIDHRVRRGAAGESIAQEAADWKADLIVVGSQGKGWVDRLVIGSTTERLANLLPTSILVLPVAASLERAAAEELAEAILR